MVVRGRDGTLWSALSGVAFEGPQKGKRLQRLPSTITEWGYWLMLHPESTAYDLFDGKKYQNVDLPTKMTAEASSSMGEVDSRLPALARVMGVRVGERTIAFPLATNEERAVYAARAGDRDV